MILRLILLALLLPALSGAGQGMGPGPGFKTYSGGGGPSDLYTAATAVWDFENNANDTKGTYNLTENGTPTYSSGDKKQGSYAADLEADSTQYFSHADNAALDIGASDASWSMWVKFETVANSQLINKYNGTDGGGYLLQVDYDTAQHLKVKMEQSWSATENWTTWTPSTGTWYHIAISYDDSADQVTIWVSQSSFGDVINGSTYTNTRQPTDNTALLKIGNYASSYFDGLMDEVVYWKGYEITATDAQALFGGSWR